MPCEILERSLNPTLRYSNLTGLGMVTRHAFVGTFHNIAPN